MDLTLYKLIQTNLTKQKKTKQNKNCFYIILIVILIIQIDIITSTL